MDEHTGVFKRCSRGIPTRREITPSRSTNVEATDINKGHDDLHDRSRPIALHTTANNASGSCNIRHPSEITR